MFKKIKKEIHDWAYDIDGLNARKKEAIDLILPNLESIEAIWDESLLRLNYAEEKIKIQAEMFYASGNNDFLSQYNSGKIALIRSQYHGKYNSEEALLLAIKKIVDELNLDLENKDIKRLYNCIVSFDRINLMSEISRKQLYAEKAEKIYSLIVAINSYQKKYIDISNFIGLSIDVNTTLGVNGIKIKQQDPIALNYIDSLLNLANKFRTELSFINARNITRK